MPSSAIARVLQLALALTVIVGVAGGPRAAAAPSDAKTRELEQQRREVEERKAAAAREIDALRASDAQLNQALETLTGQVRYQEASLASARQAAAAAEAYARKLREQQERTETRLRDLRGQLRDVAVDAYMRGPSANLGIALAARDVGDAVRRQQFARIVANRQSEVADGLRATTEDLAVQRATGDAAAVKAAERKRAVQSRLDELRSSVVAQERVADDVETRLDARLAEADALAQLDATIAAQIKARQAELARLAAARAAAARAAAATRPSRIASGTSRIVPIPGGLATVRGITVAATLAPQLAALLDAADADGVSFSGGGYRDPQAQVEVRRANCGTSNYAMYEMPPSQCSPPTARPGTSMHEQGLAIDFTYNGRLITSRSNAGYRWLASNAGRFGLRNLPEEPWHWSTNGR